MTRVYNTSALVQVSSYWTQLLDLSGHESASIKLVLGPSEMHWAQIKPSEIHAFTHDPKQPPKSHKIMTQEIEFIFSFK